MDNRKTDKQLTDRVVKIYKQAEIPYDIRFYCEHYLRNEIKW